MAKKAAFCLASTMAQAQRIIDSLKGSGFSSNDISMLTPDKSGSRDFAIEHHTKAPEAAAAAAAVVGLFGAWLGWLAGMGTIAIPGMRAFIAAGPIMAALSAGAIGVAAGAVAGALIGLGIPEYEAKRYTGKVHEGQILISVHTEDRHQRARATRIFNAAQAEDVSCANEAQV